MDLVRKVLRCVAVGLCVVALVVGVKLGLDVRLGRSWDCVRDMLVAAVTLGVGLVLYSLGHEPKRVVKRRRIRVTKESVRGLVVDAVIGLVGCVALVFMLVSVSRGLDVRLSWSVDCVRDVLVAAWPAAFGALLGIGARKVSDSRPVRKFRRG